TLMAARIPADGERGSQPVGVRYPTATGADALGRLCRGAPDQRSIVPRDMPPTENHKPKFVGRIGKELALNASGVGASIYRLIGFERKRCHVCHPDRLRGGRSLALGLSVRGHQSGRYGVSASLLPRTALSGHRSAACSVRQKAHASTVRPYRSHFDLPWWTELRALLCWPWARLGKHVGRRISTRHALPRPVSLAAARGEAVSHHVHRSAACIRR